MAKKKKKLNKKKYNNKKKKIITNNTKKSNKRKKKKYSKNTIILKNNKSNKKIVIKREEDKVLIGDTEEILEVKEEPKEDIKEIVKEKVKPKKEIKKTKPKKKKNKKKSKKKKKKKSFSLKNINKKLLIALSLLFILIIIIIINTLNIFVWSKDEINLKKQIDKIQENINIVEAKDNDNTEIIENEKIPKKNPYWDYIKMNLIDVDFNDLKKQNNDTVGWIQVNGTNINYPFVQASDNKFYLTHAFNKKKNGGGWVFLDYRNSLSSSEKNTIIYAHGRVNNTMFGSLKNILKSSWVNNKDNYIIKMSTEYENTLWQVFSVYRIPTTSDYLKINFNSNDEFMDFINKLIGRSQYDFNAIVNEDDQIITLSTCYNDADKVVLHAKLIKREKK